MNQSIYNNPKHQPSSTSSDTENNEVIKIIEGSYSNRLITLSLPLWFEIVWSFIIVCPVCFLRGDVCRFVSLIMEAWIWVRCTGNAVFIAVAVVLIGVRTEFYHFIGFCFHRLTRSHLTLNVFTNTLVVGVLLFFGLGKIYIAFCIISWIGGILPGI